MFDGKTRVVSVKIRHLCTIYDIRGDLLHAINHLVAAIQFQWRYPITLQFQDTNFYFKTIRKRRFYIFLFDVLLGPYGETHRVKGCDKNVSLFLIVRRKMAYLLISLKSEFIWPPFLNLLDFYFWGFMKD